MKTSYYSRHTEEMNEKSQKWHLEHREEHIEQMKAYNAAHPNERKANDKKAHEMERAICRLHKMVIAVFRALSKEEKKALRDEFKRKYEWNGENWINKRTHKVA